MVHCLGCSFYHALSFGIFAFCLFAFELLCSLSLPGVSTRGLRSSRLFNKDAQTDLLVVNVVFGLVGGTSGDI